MVKNNTKGSELNEKIEGSFKGAVRTPLDSLMLLFSDLAILYITRDSLKLLKFFVFDPIALTTNAFSLNLAICRACSFPYRQASQFVAQ